MKPIFYLLVAHFLAAQAIALFAGWHFISAGLSIVEQPAAVENAVILFAYIMAFAAVLLLVLKYYKGRLLFLLLEIYLIFASVQILAAIFLSDLAGLGLAAAALALRLRFPEARRYLLIVVAGVVSALVGSSLEMLPMAVFAVLLSGYDYVAVFVTKHMITLVKELGKREAATSVKLKYKRSHVELGTGDLVIPGALVVSAMKLSMAHALVTSLGALAGLLAVLAILSRRRGYLPALPPIVGYALAAFAAYHFISI